MDIERYHKANGATKAEIRVLEEEIEKFFVIDSDIRDQLRRVPQLPQRYEQP